MFSFISICIGFEKNKERLWRNLEIPGVHARHYQLHITKAWTMYLRLYLFLFELSYDYVNYLLLFITQVPIFKE